ncbi:hypothetical protein [Kitasatospora sp. MBT63]|uniref:hypothetical protein n=1 Tax=Kitasatospora sp. MBT63 TaxID=1444768 RepID=UPI000AACF29B|nr:hypothetical protein [Kitasatospora sp. MBT63]
MGVLDAVAGRVAGGAVVEFRPSGSSMVPLVRSRQLVAVAPVDPAKVEVGDIVLARVGGTVYLHLVSAVDRARQRVQISNNRGRVNGWTGHDRVFGICTAVEGVPRAGTDGKLRRPATDPRPAQSAASAGLPDGWTIERVRAESGDGTATLLPPWRPVLVERADGADYDRLRPEAILSFHGLCLVLADGEWFMGELDTDGSLVCWSSYGPDLGVAIQGL